VVTTLAGSVDDPEQRRVDSQQRRRHERDKGTTVRGASRLFDRTRVEAVVERQCGAGNKGSRHGGQPADVRQREARDPSVADRVDVEALARRHRRRAHRVVGEHDAFGFPGGAARCDDQRVTFFHRLLDLHRLDDASRCALRQAWVDGKDGVPGVPRSLERVDKCSRAARVERDEPSHGLEVWQDVATTVLP
jgi:hypothetical protein